MESQKIKILLDKYWAAETSEKEEIQLKKYFRNEIPKAESKYQPVFEYNNLLQNENESFDLSFLDQKAERKPVFSLISKKSFKRLASGIAAAILVAVGSVWFQWETLETPQMAADDEVKNAYEETVTALAFLSEKLNKGKATIYELSTFDKTTKQIIDEGN